MTLLVKVKRGLGVVALLCAVAFAPVVYAQDGATDCSNPHTQVDINACSYQGYEKADHRMNELYQQKMKALQQDKSKQRLRDAQKAWLTFRDKSCLYEVGEREESGSIWALQQNACLQAWTERRVEELQKYGACTKPEDGCPE